MAVDMWEDLIDLKFTVNDIDMAISRQEFGYTLLRMDIYRWYAILECSLLSTSFCQTAPLYELLQL